MNEKAKKRLLYKGSKKMIKEILKDCVPPILWRQLIRIKSKNKPYKEVNIPYFCPTCNHVVKEFHKLSNYFTDMMEKHECIHSIYCYETLNHKKYSCPFCGASDRCRLQSIYLNTILNTWQKEEKECKLLDIAPDKRLADSIKTYKHVRYRSADLFMEGVDDKIDITDMNIYEDSSFDIILCSHVLEHIEDDRKAMSELFRILKPAGFAIVMVPVHMYLTDDFENSEYETEAERWKYFGQNDHVRVYSKNGFVNKLIQTGFKVNQLGIDYFGEAVFNKSGLSKSSVLYVVEKSQR